MGVVGMGPENLHFLRVVWGVLRGCGGEWVAGDLTGWPESLVVHLVMNMLAFKT